MKRKYYTNGRNEKRLYPDEEIPEGYYPGRIKSTITTKDKIWINNGEKAIFIDKDTIIPDGFVKGRLKEHLNPKKQSLTMKERHFNHYTDGINDFVFSDKDIIPKGLNKGRPKMKDEQKQKLSSSHLGLHHTDETKKKISEHSNNNREKAFETIIYTYGSLENYYKELHQKGNETKKRNNSFNSSKPEINFYNILCESYGKENVLRNYKDKERYPFYCDFYIKSLDKFIELNLHWTHGSLPYNKDDLECQKQLEIWQEKAKTSQFYQNAIETWTVRDVEKQKIAKENNLNYEVIY